MTESQAASSAVTGAAGATPVRERPPGRRWNIGEAGAAIALIALLVFNAFATRGFLSLQTFNVNLTQVAPIVIVAVGMALVIATGGIDLSVGAVASFAGTLAAVLLTQSTGLFATPAIALAASLTLPLVAAALAGCINGLLVSKARIQPIVATLILFIAGRGFAQMLTESNLRTFSNDGFTLLRANVAGIPLQGLVMLLVVAGGAWLVRKTLFGRHLLVVGGNEKAARLAGIGVARVKLAAYVICSVLAGFAGLINVAMNSAADPAQIGLGIELDAIAAVAVGGTTLAGGTARIAGTLVGALVIQLLTYTLLAHNVPDEQAQIVKAGIILVAVYLQRKKTA